VDSSPKNIILAKVAEAAAVADEAEEAYMDALGRLQTLMKQARAAGASLSEIARMAGISRARVQQVTKRD
jgi:NADH:ubiquinone oxidoreductase subunit E